MELLTLGEIAEATGGRLAARSPGVEVSSVDTDSREIRTGSLFVALKGPRFDGHDHAMRAVAKGAIAALVSRGRLKDFPAAAVEVDDPLSALGRLAASYRRRFEAKVVGITGSNGKTTTKELLAAICRNAGGTVASPKSFNNAIGLPLTLMEMSRYTKYVVLEMGANAPGELSALSEIALPDIAVVTNVGRAHLGGFGGTVEHVARAKGELVEAVARRGGTVILNADDPNSKPLFERAKGARILTFSLSEEIGLSPRTAFRRRRGDVIPGGGRHNQANAYAALAAAEALGIGSLTAAAALKEGYEPPPMRLEERAVGKVRLVNDAYNANPDSMKAGLEWLGQEDGRKVACLGEMLELGDSSEPLHVEAGVTAAGAGVSLLVAVGPAGKWIVEGYRSAGGKQALLLPDAGSAGKELARLLEPGDVVLFKASRGSALERAVEACARALEA